MCRFRRNRRRRFLLLQVRMKETPRRIPREKRRRSYLDRGMLDRSICQLHAAKARVFRELVWCFFHSPFVQGQFSFFFGD